MSVFNFNNNEYVKVYKQPVNDANVIIILVNIPLRGNIPKKRNLTSFKKITRPNSRNFRNEKLFLDGSKPVTYLKETVRDVN